MTESIPERLNLSGILLLYEPNRTMDVIMIFAADLYSMTIGKSSIITMDRIAKKQLTAIPDYDLGVSLLGRPCRKGLSCIIQIDQIVHMMVGIQISMTDRAGIGFCSWLIRKILQRRIKNTLLYQFIGLCHRRRNSHDTACVSTCKKPDAFSNGYLIAILIQNTETSLRC